MNDKTKLAEVGLGEVLALSKDVGNVKLTDATGKPYTALPPGWTIADLSAYIGAPMRAKGNVPFGDAVSFARYVNKHKDASAGEDKDDVHTVVLVDVLKGKFKAVFNHNASNAPGWQDHTASYDCPITPEWQIWTQNDGRKMSQEDFAFFIEENILDIHAPTGAEMLELVTTLKSVKNVNFDSGIRLSDGQVQLKYHEEAKTTAGAAGNMTIPEEIKLGMAVYMGGTAYAVMAKFRYRIEGAKLVLWYDLVRPHKVVEAAVADVRKLIEEKTQIEAYAVAAV